jgi:tetratricopeptide (TPR) repeat protein
MNCRFTSVVIGFLIFSFPSSFAADKPWIEVDSPHFRIFSNGTPNDARHVAHEFEQLRYVFATQFPDFRLESGAPLMVFAARDEDTARSLEPNVWKLKGVKPAGIFHHGWEKEYVLVRLDSWGEGAREIVYHEYTHSILRLNSRWLPTWLDEGMAEYYAYTRFQEHLIYLGAPSERVGILRAKTLYPVENLIGDLSQYRNDPDEAQIFYAESWALVHFLTFSPGMQNGARLNQFYRALQQGTPQKKAFEDTFGSFKTIDASLGDYVRNYSFHAYRLPNPPKIEDKDFTVRTLTLAETDAELAGYHLWTRDFDGARPLVQQALKSDPKLGLAHEDSGILQFSEAHDVEALTEFSRAADLDGNLYLSVFAKTMLSQTVNSENRADQDSVRAALQQVLNTNPQFAAAWVEMARVDMRENDIDGALAASRKAEQLEPSRAGYHLQSGQILLRMRKGGDSAAFAKFVADRWTGPDHNEAVELWNAVPAEQRPEGESLDPIVPKDSQSVTGTVQSVECSGGPENLKLVLAHDNQLLTFRRKGAMITGFSDTLWYGADHFNVCHHVEGKRAIVHYHPAADASYAGDLAEVEIRDDLPAAFKNAAEAKEEAGKSNN